MSYGSDYLDDPVTYGSIAGASDCMAITHGYHSARARLCSKQDLPIDSTALKLSVKWILRYLPGSTLALSLALQPALTSFPLTLQKICHADWASHVDDRRSTSEACSCVFLALAASEVHWV